MQRMHGHLDGVALAIADASHSASSAGYTDTSYDLEIGRRVTRLWLLVAAGFAMTLLSASLAFDWWDGASHYDAMMGYAGVAVFGLITGRLIWMLPDQRGPVVIVTPYGIRDLRIGNEFLLWDLIADVSAEKSRGHKAVVLTVTPALQRQLSWIHASSRDMPNDRIVIQTEDLATDFDTLFGACRDRHAAATSQSPLRRDRDYAAPNLAAPAT